MKAIEIAHPPAHNRYRVWREDIGFFTATPCYGMHHPWWVPRNEFTKEESEPVMMKDTDLWMPLPTAPKVEEGEASAQVAVLYDAAKAALDETEFHKLPCGEYQVLLKGAHTSGHIKLRKVMLAIAPQSGEGTE